MGAVGEVIDKYLRMTFVSTSISNYSIGFPIIGFLINIMFIYVLNSFT